MTDEITDKNNTEKSTDGTIFLGLCLATLGVAGLAITFLAFPPNALYGYKLLSLAAVGVGCVMTVVGQGRMEVKRK